MRRRLLAGVAGLVVVVALALIAAGAGGAGGKPYLVRAIFDNAGFVIAGEDVKVAGVKVGVVDSLHVTDDDRAAVVLRIEDPGYQDFRSDARCIVRPQSLIGEKFVECTPTRKRAVGARATAPLEVIERGPGEGQRLLPVENTTKAVDLDLIANTMRLPYRQRFSLILNELGTGLAGRGEELGEVIRRADPALREVDEVLEILADQNTTLARLAQDSDRAIAPLAEKRSDVTDFIEQSGQLAAATAERREDLQAALERLPGFLRELTPTMARLGELSEQATPVVSDLGDRAPQINRIVSEIGPFTRAATPALETLGDATEVGRPALETARPVVRDLGTLARSVRPVGRSLEGLLTSFRRTGGIESLMNFFFYSASAINGYDDFGHYLRANLLVNTCSNYVTTPINGCTANFRPPAEEEAEVASVRQAQTAAASPPAPAPAPSEAKSSLDAKPTSDAGSSSDARSALDAGSTPDAGSSPDVAQTALLDYLFGDGR